MVYNPVVLIISRGSQIFQNYKQKQTGAQSAATTGLNLVGTIIRIGTTIKEVGWDFHILRAYRYVELDIVCTTVCLQREYRETFEESEGKEV